MNRPEVDADAPGRIAAEGQHLQTAHQLDAGPVVWAMQHEASAPGPSGPDQAAAHLPGVQPGRVDPRGAPPSGHWVLDRPLAGQGPPGASVRAVEDQPRLT